MENEPPRSPRYKHTRELVRIALQEGMTQSEIARICRTTQSMVSDWANGKKKAAENVIKPLLDRYGHRLRRASFRLYLVQLAPEIPWEQTESGKVALRLVQDPEGYVRTQQSPEAWAAWVRPYVRRKWKPVAPSLPTVDAPAPKTPGRGRQASSAPSRPPADTEQVTEEDLLPITDADLEQASKTLDYHRHPLVEAAWAGLGLGPLFSQPFPDTLEAMKADYLRPYQRLTRLEGAPLWRHVLAEPTPTTAYLGRTEVNGIAMEPRRRLLIHPAMESGQFWLISQDRRHLTGSELYQWELQKEKIRRIGPEDKAEVRSEDDVARWIGTVHGPLSLSELLATVEAHLKDAGPHDRAVVPFTLRKALAEHGYVLEDILSPFQVNPSKSNTIPKIVP